MGYLLHSRAPVEWLAADWGFWWDHFCEIIAIAQRDDAQRYRFIFFRCAHESIDDFMNGPITADRDNL